MSATTGCPAPRLPCATAVWRLRSHPRASLLLTPLAVARHWLSGATAVPHHAVRAPQAVRAPRLSARLSGGSAERQALRSLYPVQREISGSIIEGFESYFTGIRNRGLGVVNGVCGALFSR
ncbi:hypothetical protein Nepgr_030704 [Nepenthes gracilis]|uniref:Uncharacterized protein n=1 Tax=Nepenthes gracilis TaxID=150966 RepID=A0AAD3Y6U3_NEPGR|nr:hypothetical protein Nepgr_030704 [Nepenthes gracilis]